ncbi:MAG: hypothetical protein GXY83_36080 [Rhodopirellula sp.]|nr:hypothetical protein [Rhodopirellula sp.]
MKKDQVHIGGTYVAKVSGQLARVRIDAESRFGGWDATNVLTNRKVRIKSAQRLRREVRNENEGSPPPAKTPVIPDDRPPQDIDERLAAAPPSIVPYEQRRARAEAAQSEASDDGGLAYDPSRCATPRCKGTPAMTYLGRPLCQACWDRQCEEEQPSEVSENAGDACCPTEEPLEEENAMSKKKSTKKQSTKKQTKAQPAAAKAKGARKAAKPKAKAAVATATKTPKAKKAAGEQKPKRVSALDAAAQVLAKAGKPMRAQELIAAMAEQNLWKSPGGATPHATLYAAMQREERDKGTASRFRKVDRGLFAFNAEGK